MKNIPDYAFYELNDKWVQRLEENTNEIKQELQNVINIKAAPKIGDNWTQAHPNYTESKNNLQTPWKTYEFIFFGIKHLLHIEQCPKTWTLLSEIPELVTAHFSLLYPGTHVKPHKGYSRRYYEIIYL